MIKCNYEIFDRKTGVTTKVRPSKITKLFGPKSFQISRLSVGEKYEYCGKVIKCVN